MDNLLKLTHTLGKNLYNQLPIRQLSKEACVSYTTAYRLVKNHSNLFQMVKKGNIKLISINLADPITKQYMILGERNAAVHFMKKQPQFKILQSDLPAGDYTLVLFGSRAEGKEREMSDIDICIINRDGNKTVKLSKFEHLFKVEINPIYFSENEFGHMLQDRDHNIAKEIIKKHIVLFGEEYFWNLIWKNGI